MSFFNAMDISGSALTAQRKRMDIITQNMSNINTTRTADGTAYRRRVVVMKEATDFKSSFSSFVKSAKGSFVGKGVVVSEITEDPSDFRMEYDPNHPDAGADGYVRYPNVDQVKEMVDMISASRAYEANVTAINATKAMAVKALEIGR